MRALYNNDLMKKTVRVTGLFFFRYSTDKTLTKVFCEIEIRKLVYSMVLCIISKTIVDCCNLS